MARAMRRKERDAAAVLERLGYRFVEDSAEDLRPGASASTRPATPGASATVDTDGDEPGGDRE
jgi:hypothetical protein